MTIGRSRWFAPCAVILIWCAIHWAFRDIFIFHDSWNFNFPQVYDVAKNSACGQFGFWLSSDTGTPAVIYVISFALTQVFRIILINWWACSLPTPIGAMLIYKAQIFVVYLGFAFGMYVLGRSILRHRLSALYLMAATLFAGACLDAVHSDQVAIMMFWVPWCAAALAIAFRYSDDYRGACYANLAALFFCMQLLDLYPHIPALAAVYAAGVYVLLWRLEAWRFLVKVFWRTWPACIFVAMTVMALYAIYRQIFDFQPQQRTALQLAPSQFGQTGFVQPSAFFGSLFPLTFTAAFEDLGARYNWRGFIYRLDVALLYLGTLPIWFTLALVPRRGINRVVFGWLLFSVLVTLTALQPTRFYFAIHHLPFFNLFRIYFHFFCYAVIGFLVVSAYGFDRVVTASPGDRMAILRTTFLLGTGFVALGALTLIIFALRKGQSAGLSAYLVPIMGDICIILVALGVIYVGARRAMPVERFAALAVSALILTQGVHIAGIYGMLGEPSQTTFARYQMDQQMLIPLDAADWKEPGRIMRVTCEKSTGCNLAQRPAVSLKIDTDGSFFRDNQSPLLRATLSYDVKSALLGVSHPILWATPGLTAVRSFEALDDEFAKHSGDVADLLRRTTYVVGLPLENETAKRSPVAPAPEIEFANMKILPNRIAFRYRAGEEGYANLSLTAAPGWQAMVAGKPTPIVRGYYNLTAVRVPSGEGEVVLEYRDPLAAYLIYSRMLLAFLASVGAIFLVRSAIASRSADAS